MKVILAQKDITNAQITEIQMYICIIVILNCCILLLICITLWNRLKKKVEFSPADSKKNVDLIHLQGTQISVVN